MSFGRNFEFWRVGVVECKKTSILKTEFSSPLKIFFFCILRVSDSQTSHEPTREMCRWTGQNFIGQVWVANHLRGSYETLCLKFLRNWNSLRILRLGTICESSREMAKHNFSTQRIWHFKKNIQKQSDKNHFQKQIKYSKIFLGFIIK